MVRGIMAHDATVDQLQRYLQEQLVEAEDIPNVEQRKQNYKIRNSIIRGH